MNEYMKISHYLPNTADKTAGNKTLLPFQIEDRKTSVKSCIL